MKKDFTKTIKLFNKESSTSLHQLQKLNHELDMQRQTTFHHHEQIKNQKKLDRQNQNLISNSIKSIQEEGRYLSRFLQQERTKYNHLQILVKNAQSQIYSNKLQKYEDVMNNKQTDQYQQYKKILNQKQKDLQKILEKSNTSLFQTSKKIDFIRSIRSERAVHSQLFNNLEHQYFDVEFYYKQLLMERTLAQRKLDEEIDYFNEIKKKSKLHSFKIMNHQDNSKINNLNQNEISQNPPIEQYEISFRSQLKTQMPKVSKPRNKRLSSSDSFQQKDQQQAKNIQYKKKVLNLLNDLKCGSLQQLKQKSLQIRLSESQNVFNESNQLFEQISRLQSSIKNLSGSIRDNYSVGNHSFNPKINILKQKIAEFGAQVKEIKSEVVEFKEEFQKVFQSVSEGEFKKSQKFCLKQSVSLDMNFSQKQQILRDMMSHFNDEILDKLLLPENQLYSTQRYRRDRKSFVKAKFRNYSLFDSRLRKQGVTGRQEQSQAELLDQLIGQSGRLNNDRSSVSILSEEQLIEESRKLMKQSKKKSEFNATFKGSFGREVKNA